MTTGTLVQSRYDPEHVGVIVRKAERFVGGKSWVVLWYSGYRQGFISTEKQEMLVDLSEKPDPQE
jgi:hypothetical protein